MKVTLLLFQDIGCSQAGPENGGEEVDTEKYIY
jgi:hypothetical protein